MSSLKDTMKHASIYSSASVLGRLVSFLMLPFYAHILRDNGYAVIGMLDAGVALLVTMLAYGVRGTNILFYHEEKDPAKKKTVISTGIFVIVVVAGALTIPGIIFSRPIAGLLLDNPDYNHLLIMALISFVFQMGGQGASSWLLIQSHSVKFVAINLFKLILGLSLNIWLVLIQDMGLNGFFISALVTAIMGNSLLMYIAFKNCGTRYDHVVAIKMRDFLLPLIPGNMVSFVSRQIERYLVKFQIDLSSVGVLEMGYKFPVLISQLITTPFMQSWNTRRLEIADQPDAGRKLGQMFTFFLFLVSFLGLVMAVIIKPALVILTPAEFHPAYRIAQVDIITIIFNGVYYHVTFGLFYTKHTRTVALIKGWTSAVKIGLAWICISMWGIAGAAWAAAIISVSAASLGYHFAQKHYQIHLEWKKILSMSGVAVGMFLFLSNWDPSGTTIYQTINGNWLPALTEKIVASPLGTWKDGKVSIILAERSAPLTECVLKGGLSALFGFYFVLVHDGTKKKMLRVLRSLTRQSQA